MKQALKQTLLLWAGLLLLGGLALLLAITPPARNWMWQQTGETDFLSQVKGVSDLAGSLLRPRLDLQPQAVTRHADVADVNPYGVNVFLEQEVEPAKREQVVRMAADAGFHWLRQEFPWEDIEIHGKGDFEDRRHEPHRSAWEKYDHIVSLAEEYDMELIVRLSNPPTWSRSGSDDEVGTYAPPDDYQDYADFVRAVVERYEGRVRYYQLWNEPNIYPEWGNIQPVSPDAYTDLLRAGATAARDADPNVVIVAGAVAATIDLDGTVLPARDFNDLLFLQRMYDAGASPYFDIVAVQGYGLWSGPTDRRMHPRVINFSRAQLVRDLMVANGDAAKPIWISEMNWNAAPDGVQPRYGRVTLEQQARYLPLALERIEQEWPWLGVANVWYMKRADDRWLRNEQPEAYFQLVAPDFTPQPVYESVKSYIQSASQAEAD